MDIISMPYRKWRDSGCNSRGKNKQTKRVPRVPIKGYKQYFGEEWTKDRRSR